MIFKKLKKYYFDAFLNKKLKELSIKLKELMILNSILHCSSTLRSIVDLNSEIT